ncbi:unnamed protein product, partial [marine sediment metagenome]
MDNNLIESLKRAVSISKATRAQKLKKVPVRLIYSKILELINRWLDKPFKVKAKTFWGEEMFLIIPEVVSLSIYRYGFHEENLTKMISEYLKPGMTFFDIGAHFGYFTMLVSYIVGEKGMVHSFEPISNTYEVLIQN